MMAMREFNTVNARDIWTLTWCEIVKHYPLLTSWETGQYWTGFICIQGTLVRLAIKAPNFPSAKGVSIEGDDHSRKFISPNKDAINEILKTECTLNKFIGHLVSILMKHMEENLKQSKFIVDSLFYTDLLAELESIGLSNIDFVGSNFREVHARHFDSAGRKHIIKMILPPRYPHQEAKIVDELPSENSENRIWPSKISDAFRLFANSVEKYTQFWTEIEDIDAKLKVVDPLQPSKSHTYRRLLINDKTILHLVLHPLKPKTFPELTISGPDSMVDHFNRLVDQNCINWNDSLPVVQNLQSILECNFIPKGDEQEGYKDSTEITCTICYAYNLEDEIPETVCDCGAIYHNTCLYELFINDCGKKGLRRYVDCPICDMVKEIKVNVVQVSTW